MTPCALGCRPNCMQLCFRYGSVVKAVSIPSTMVPSLSMDGAGSETGMTSGTITAAIGGIGDIEGEDKRSGLCGFDRRWRDPRNGLYEGLLPECGYHGSRFGSKQQPEHGPLQPEGRGAGTTGLYTWSGGAPNLVGDGARPHLRRPHASGHP